MTIDEAAEITSISPNQLREWANDEPTFPAFKIGKKIIIPVKDLEEWLSMRARARAGFPPISPIVARIRAKRKKEREA